MKKDGFVFLESVVVLVVVALSLAMMISSYSLITRKTKEKEYYNKASDKYLLYAISNLGTDDICNYSISCNITSDPRDVRNYVNFHATIGNCETTKVGKIMYDCKSVFSEMNLAHLYVVENIIDELYNVGKDRNHDGVINTSDNVLNFYDNGTIEYMKTLTKCREGYDKSTNPPTCTKPVSYLIGVFERGSNDYYYAAIEI